MQEYKLEIDVNKQTIKGVTIHDHQVLQQIHFVVTNNPFEGLKTDS